ncbi:Glycosyltransferase involved in cell wall bisynthesis [Amycolatopsis arida]|uniref:Glycosyltransferase involved in cell wall bisynthesis n=1 Tax=Amycolatopsis arida TaxID=587909 RepID=A0A1I5YJV9_9PSEU|nr:glycosyltransferase involved in cell wall biosynthesis [Amycolatopsis arida]SFQ44492.1 Glycosyltransferase involved in cell wall bisynthesis [Amycolatopsis arida]
MFALEIFIPYHGNPEFLFRAIRSVQALEDTKWRLTILEDCYPDGDAVRRRVEELDDGRITYLRNDRNLGPGLTQLRCIHMAEWDHFTVMDYDDMLLPNYGRVVADLFARHPDATFAQPNVEIVDEHDQPHRPLPDRIKWLVGARGREVVLAGEPGVRSLLRANWTYNPALCYRRGPITERLEHRPGIDCVCDLGRIVDIILAGGSLVVGSEVAFRYRRHRTSHSSSNARSGERFAQERNYFTGMAAELRARGWNSAARASRMRLFSRFNALSQLPGALAGRNGELAGLLTRHALR